MILFFLGSVLALSHGTRIDTSDCVALLPAGCLIRELTFHNMYSINTK